MNPSSSSRMAAGDSVAARSAGIETVFYCDLNSLSLQGVSDSLQRSALRSGLPYMAVLFAAFALFALQNPAKDLLLEVRKHYAGLKRFEATIVHHNSSGLFPGDYEQRLTWTGKNTFELIVTKRSGFKPVDGKTGWLAPDYRAKDGMVTSRRTDGSEDRSSVVPHPNTSPGWEVSGGPALMFLENTRGADFWFNPPSGFSIALSMGATQLWQERAVREIVADMKGQGQTLKVSIFIDPKLPLLVGVAHNDAGGGWTIYDKVRT